MVSPVSLNSTSKMYLMRPVGEGHHNHHHNETPDGGHVHSDGSVCYADHSGTQNHHKKSTENKSSGNNTGWYLLLGALGLGGLVTWLFNRGKSSVVANNVQDASTQDSNTDASS